MYNSYCLKVWDELFPLNKTFKNIQFICIDTGDVKKWLRMGSFTIIKMFPAGIFPLTVDCLSQRTCFADSTFSINNVRK